MYIIDDHISTITDLQRGIQGRLFLQQLYVILYPHLQASYWSAQETGRVNHLTGTSVNPSFYTPAILFQINRVKNGGVGSSALIIVHGDVCYMVQHE